MFDLKSFIRQLLPPHRRNPLTIALARILFGPAQKIMADLSAVRTSLLQDVATTGQTMVLENLLTKAVSGLTNSTVFIAEGNSVNVDFTAIVPADVPEAKWGDLRRLIDRYKLAGTRYTLAKSIGFDIGDEGGALTWASGFPFLRGGKLHYAINKVGTYRVSISTGGTVIFEQDELFIGITDDHSFSVDDSKEYRLIVGPMESFVRKVGSTLSPVMGYDWNMANVRTLIIGLNASIPPTVAISATGLGQTKTARAFGVTLNDVDYEYSISFDNVPSELVSVLAHITTDGVRIQQKGYVILTDANSGQGTINQGDPPYNQPPVQTRPIPDQTGKVGVAFNLVILGDTFTDPDGQLMDVSLVGLPSGLIYTARLYSDGFVNRIEVTISGTPTVSGTFSIAVTAHDDQSARTTDTFVLVIDSDKPDERPPGPGPGDSGTTVIDPPSRPDLLDLAIEWTTIGGQPMARLFNRATPSGSKVMYFLNGQDIPFEGSLPNDLYYQPGTKINCYLGIGPRREIYPDGYPVKSQQHVYIGNPPNV